MTPKTRYGSPKGPKYSSPSPLMSDAPYSFQKLPKSDSGDVDDAIDVAAMVDAEDVESGCTVAGIVVDSAVNDVGWLAAEDPAAWPTVAACAASPAASVVGRGGVNGVNVEAAVAFPA